MKAVDCKVGMNVRRHVLMTDDSVGATIVALPDYRGVVTIKLDDDGSTEVTHCQWLTKVDAATDVRVEQASGIADDIRAQLVEINQKLDAILSLLANGTRDSRPSPGDACAICGLAYDVHSEAFGMKPGLPISSCAVSAGLSASCCQMCEGKCITPHVFARIS